MSAAPTLTLDDVVTSTVDSHPQPNQQAPEIVREVMRLHSGEESTSTPAPASPVAPPPGTLDSKGTPYDPTIHVDSGEVVTARGTWRKRRGEPQPAGADVTGPELPPLDADPPPSTPVAGAQAGGAAPAPLDHDAIASAWVDRAVSVLRVLLGPEWEPSPEERRDLTGSAARYMQARNFTMDLTPGWALLTAVALYGAPRAALPTTRDRVRSIVSRVIHRDDAQASQAPEPPQAPPADGYNPFGESR